MVAGEGERCFKSDSGTIVLRRLNQYVVHIEWNGVFLDDSLPVIDSYLAELERITQASDDRVHQLHDMMGLRRYSKGVILRHVAFSEKLESQIGRIAAVSRGALIYLAVATVAAWQRRPVRTFYDSSAALEWLNQS